MYKLGFLNAEYGTFIYQTQRNAVFSNFILSLIIWCQFLEEFSVNISGLARKKPTTKNPKNPLIKIVKNLGFL